MVNLEHKFDFTFGPYGKYKKFMAHLKHLILPPKWSKIAQNKKVKK